MGGGGWGVGRLKNTIPHYAGKQRRDAGHDLSTYIHIIYAYTDRYRTYSSYTHVILKNCDHAMYILVCIIVVIKW